MDYLKGKWHFKGKNNLRWWLTSGKSYIFKGKNCEKPVDLKGKQHFKISLWMTRGEMTFQHIPGWKWLTLRIIHLTYSKYSWRKLMIWRESGMLEKPRDILVDSKGSGMLNVPRMKLHTCSWKGSWEKVDDPCLMWPMVTHVVNWNNLHLRLPQRAESWWPGIPPS